MKLAVCALLAMVVSCSSDNPTTSDPSTLSPGGTFPVGTQATITQNGTYNLPASITRLAWACTGSVSVVVQSQAGLSEQTCTDGAQSVAVQGPGTVEIQLGSDASLVATATDS